LNEQEWLTCADPILMLEFLRNGGKASERKLRLFAVACCRRLWHVLSEERWRDLVDKAEQQVDMAHGQDIQFDVPSIQTALQNAPGLAKWSAVSAVIRLAQFGQMTQADFWNCVVIPASEEAAACIHVTDGNALAGAIETGRCVAASFADNIWR
jgi:hypothetical protein